jgi:protein kinase C substrate 80K-H
MRRPVLLQLASASIVLANIPVGVAPEDAKLYAPSSENTFSCLTHPSISIPFSRVNDDFCDCPDGSDEPGTSACATLPPHDLSIRGFYCANKHHTPAFLPVSRVNDGICDYDFCCDGSDEYLGVGGIKCENRCKEIGNAARKLASERLRVRSAGGKLRDELIRKAGVLRKEIEDNIATTKAKIEGQEVKVKALEEELKETEARERAKVVKNPKPGSKVSVVAQVAREKLDEYKNGLTKLRAERNAAEEKLEKTEAILRAFKEEYNPNFNDEGVKRAVREWEEYLAGNEAQEKNAAEERDLENLLNEDGIDWDELIGDAGELDDDVAAR